MVRRTSAIGLIAALLAIAPSGTQARSTGLIFVSFGSIDHLVVIDPRINRIVKDLKTSRGPRDMHFNADHSRLYVACRDDDVIDVIDVATLKIVAKHDTISKPEAFGIDEKRRRLYVANREAASLAIIDMDQNIVVREVPTDAGPGGILVDEGRRFVFVGSEVRDFVHLIDVDSGEVVADAVVGTGRTALRRVLMATSCWCRRNWQARSTLSTGRNLKSSARSSFHLSAQGRSTLADLLITRNGQTAYVALGGAAQVAVIDVPTRRIRDYIPVGARSSSVGITHDERTLFVTNVFGNDITAIDIMSHEVTASTPVDRPPWSLVVDD